MGMKDHPHSRPLTLILPQPLSIRTLLVMKNFSGKSFNLFTIHLAPDLSKVPTVGGKPLDLYHLFVEVTSRGGLEKVIVDRKWKEVITAFQFRDTITSASFMVRKCYLSLLYHFEQVYYFRKQGRPSLTPDSANRSLANSSATDKEGAAVNDPPVQTSPVQAPGSVLPGTIDVKFDGGYVVTVNLGSEQLKGVLYHVPDVSQTSHAEGTASLQNRKRSRLASRDPSRPKSNRSGYNFFFAENYAKLKPSFQGQERAISKRIGFLWSNLSDAERQVYQEKGLRDKERYRTEMLEYKSNNSTSNTQ
ncbi:high mobility group B protein 10 isoform X3 [Abrus precatorius]|uniref:High mobility group B protein 10 isoform X3 n=1 Tax=Abrus precatorius TaxID=3816 RepID=A0A8B8JLT9_ABRPR|nr:high mobility group B protein 10 isoform X3 [Abrus precatorius]